MVASALLLALTFLLAIVFYLMDDLKFLVPYRAFLFHEYGWVLSIFLGTLFLNFFAAAFVLIASPSSKTLAGSYPTSTNSFMLET
jgi:hypothetical protein